MIFDLAVSQLYIRQQTTTNVYSRLQTFNQRLILDKCCFFAVINPHEYETAQAKPFDQNYRCTDIKEGSQTKNRYVELIKLRYTFNSKKLDYMNFTIEMVIGKKRDGKHVQYSLENIKKACN